MRPAQFSSVAVQIARPMKTAAATSQIHLGIRFMPSPILPLGALFGPSPPAESPRRPARCPWLLRGSTSRARRDRRRPAESVLRRSSTRPPLERPRETLREGRGRVPPIGGSVHRTLGGPVLASARTAARRALPLHRTQPPDAAPVKNAKAGPESPCRNWRESLLHPAGGRLAWTED
jgi:hypothetical protein